ncbi:MAG TPA: hypothetical protein VFX48_08855 [Saprospiraceae bacterium]|nr:hypothetical protein [Saprospiraceae bacterium]
MTRFPVHSARQILVYLFLHSLLSSGCQGIEAGRGDATIVAGGSDSLFTVVLLDSAEYDLRMMNLANGDSTGKWPVKGPYPLPGAILPFKRIVAYYGNLYSKQMGSLGAHPEAEMFKRLQKEVEEWEKADSATPVQPALHYIAVTAQREGEFKRLRMPGHQIDKVLNMANNINAIVFLDIQPGWSSLQDEIPKLEKYLKMPQVHLGLDPEFAMPGQHIPGDRIGTLDAKDINYASDYLAKLVRKHQLPPKILVIHRFTRDMVTNSSKIRLTPEVQIVMHMDGFGDKILKKSSYDRYIYPFPVQFAGFKLFYKNDAKAGKEGLYTPDEALRLRPKPIYIQYH